ncbi:hypothetical protein TGRUB_362420 [Toxoplasma gondii RUB]|uniref:Uncharacterized protein n=8 Tax=Toxoplasma gondii TaxID=5811 RepID=S7UW22_TOXGG|nr:hypothetical protein TGGT1_362420 [Toxoplasma gondii GT1]KFG41154.1 hypothetical protein TGDOM2_362420 [Toxoplasma gondii GAB2-2007-GAL-DOM2]KFG45295.1 hypothetical protein TGP89_362420 [Toxoplasma gondii p89]KFG53542.1 hypothetical protein TGFOU_362420 [Toxoplasma gondii FOU]KFG62084.1 hypothetical protein TGRUB_362420 [Toxoplasma gondii RUB]KFH06890.1 hypothetical protein TGVAND_362420 [Toxoplasma gondii VAND]PUA83311.1 hypothetical protein TGBR9_362420 [Toxoplasma gondii TgCATBr9]RQX73
MMQTNSRKSSAAFLIPAGEPTLKTAWVLVGKENSDSRSVTTIANTSLIVERQFLRQESRSMAATEQEMLNYCASRHDWETNSGRPFLCMFVNQSVLLFLCRHGDEEQHIMSEQLTALLHWLK